MQSRSTTTAMVGLALLLIASPAFAQVCHDGVSISKFRVIHHKSSGDEEVSSGYASTGLSVDFVLEWNNDDHPSSEGHDVTITFDYGDGTDGSSSSHTYSDGGTKNVSVTVKCTHDDDMQDDDANGVTVHVIEDIEITHMGGEAVGANNRMSFNNANTAEGKVIPDSLPAAANNMIDWITVVGNGVAFDTQKSTGILSLANGDWPDNNSSWGAGHTLNANIGGDTGAYDQSDELLQGSPGFINTSESYSAFYGATGTNKDGSDPNWFYYYKDNAGGGAYSYAPPPNKSSAHPGGGMGSVQIGDEAYAGDEYLITSVVGGQLQADDWSDTNRYFANFIGALAHEAQHAMNETDAGPPDDRDEDYLTNNFETNTSQTDPDEKYSARDAGGVPALMARVDLDDGEVFAGGPIEEDGVTNASTSHDWAHPGTQWN